MTQFRSKKDGRHYPLKGGKRVYPDQTKQGQILDKQITAKNTLPATKENIKKWKEHPNQMDIKGVDTKKENKQKENLPKSSNPYSDRQKAMSYYEKRIKVGIEDKRRLDLLLKEAKKEKVPGKSSEEVASEHYSYWKMRALGPYDASARREWENAGKTGDRKKVKYRKNFFTGYIIGRKLIDDDDKKKIFSYYPREEHGRPPHWYKTKEQADRALNRMKSQIKYPASEFNAAVTKFTEKSYLDRY